MFIEERFILVCRLIGKVSPLLIAILTYI